MANLNMADEPKIKTGLIFKIFRKNWYWFLISFVIFMLMGYMFIKIKSPLYVVHGTIMFNQNEDEDSRGGLLGSLMSSFSLAGSTGTNVEDEIYKISSHTALMEMARKLELNKGYLSSPGIFKRKIYYYGDSPIRIDIPDDVLDTISMTTNFVVKLSDGGKKIHIKAKQGTYKTVFNQDVPSLPYNVKTPLGTFTVSTTKYYNPNKDITIKASICSPDAYAFDYAKHLGVDAPSKKSNAAEIQVEDINTKRGKDIVNTLIEIYNDNSITDRRAQSEATLHFLDDRLLKLYQDLDGSESDISAYKQSNNIVNAEVEAEYIFKLKQQTDGTLINLEAESSILQMVKDFLKNDNNKYSLIPMSGNFGSFESSDALAASVEAYNELALEHMKIQSNAKSSNATLRQLESQMDALRNNLLSSLDRTISAVNIAIKRMASENSNISSRISSLPQMEQKLTNLYRDQEIKNKVYAYLLQKREETEIKLSHVLPTGKIIDEAYAETEPESPKKFLVYGFVAVLGLLLPALILYRRNRGILQDEAKKLHIAALEKEMNEITD